MHSTVYKMGNQQDLEYSTGSSAQDLVIIYKEKESGKGYISVCILSCCAVHLKLTECCESTTLQ